MAHTSVHKCIDNLPTSEECAPQHKADTTSELTNAGSAPALEPVIDSLKDTAAMESHIKL